MNVTKHSEKKFADSFVNFDKCDKNMSIGDVMFSYLVHGMPPGGFFTCILANDFIGACSRSHPNNDILTLKFLCGWITQCMPREAYGSYGAVDAWCGMTDECRRVILERHDLIYTEQEEIMLVLSES